MRSRSRSRSQRCCGALAFAGLCATSFATAAQTPGGEAAGLAREQVMELETALAQLNFDPGKIDGVIDDRTRAAIRLYQDFAALPADAKATPALLAEVLSVAQSFAEIRSTRAPDPAPDISSNAALEKPVEPQVPPREPVPLESRAAKTPDEAPSDVLAPAPVQASPPASEPGVASAEAEAAGSTAVPPSETPGKARTAPEVDSQQAAEPQEIQAPDAETAEPAKAADAPKKPEVETSVAKQSPPTPQPAPKDPVPTGKKAAAAAGYNIGGVISRLAKTSKTADKLAEPESAAGPDAAPPSGPAGNGQLGRVPAPAPAPAPTPTPGKPVDGYAAFQDAYKAAQAGDFEYAARRYTDAIESKKLTLEHLGDAYFNRANVLHFLGRYDKSIADYGVTIGTKPNFAGAYYNRGFAYQAKGDQQQAVDDFRRARDLGLRRLGVRAPDRVPPLR